MRAAAEKAAEASRALNAGEEGSDEEDEDEDQEMESDEEEEEEPEAGPSRPRAVPVPVTGTDTSLPPDGEPTEDADLSVDADQAPPAPPTIPQGPPPRIMITTSPSPCKDTYAFCEDLRGIFPGGEFFKRPKGKGFEIGRIARWAAKRGFGAVLVVNEDHKAASESERMRFGNVTPDILPVSGSSIRRYYNYEPSGWTDGLFQAHQPGARETDISSR